MENNQQPVMMYKELRRNFMSIWIAAFEWMLLWLLAAFILFPIFWAFNSSNSMVAGLNTLSRPFDQWDSVVLMWVKGISVLIALAALVKLVLDIKTIKKLKAGVILPGQALNYITFATLFFGVSTAPVDSFHTLLFIFLLFDVVGSFDRFLAEKSERSKVRLVFSLLLMSMLVGWMLYWIVAPDYYVDRLLPNGVMLRFVKLSLWLSFVTFFLMRSINRLRQEFPQPVVLTDELQERLNQETFDLYYRFCEFGRFVVVKLYFFVEQKFFKKG